MQEPLTLRDEKAGQVGRLLVAGLVSLGLAAAAIGLWFQWHQTRRCLEFYGPDVAGLIARSPRAELWLLAADPSGRPVAVDRLDISRAPGLVHLRRGLVEDANFAWGVTAEEPSWDVALVFENAGDQRASRVILAIDVGAGPMIEKPRLRSEGALTVVGQPGRVSLGRIGKGIASWVEATLAAR
jgi:hypothetical protein